MIHSLVLSAQIAAGISAQMTGNFILKTTITVFASG